MSCCGGDLAVEQARCALGGVDGRHEEIRASGRPLADGRVAYLLSAPAIHCGQCIGTIERALLRIEGVAAARVNLSLKRVMLTLDGGDRSPLPALAELERLGYPAFPLDAADAADAHSARTRELVRAMAVAGFASANIMLLSVSVWSGAEGATRDLFHLVSAAIAIPAIAWSGRVFFSSAFAALRARRMNMDVPISVGILLAVAMSLFESLSGGEAAYFDASITLVFFLLIGRTLDHLMRERARNAVASLGRLTARGAMARQEDGSAVYTPLDELKPGMVLFLAAGERAPVDGVVQKGNSEVDRSLVTGESRPEAAAPGTTLESGVLNLTGPIELKVTKDAGSSFLADVAQMMEAAEQGRGRHVRLADRLSRLYSPVVHIVALLSFLGWMAWSGGDWRLSMTVAIATLIITCPCALGLAVPVAHVVGAVRLFESGILMRDGSALERLAEADFVAFDKTGTLTTGTPAVVDCAIPPELRPVALTLAQSSIHPASRALARHLAGQAPADVAGIREIAGAGVEGMSGGRRVRLGRPQWVGEIARTGGDGVAFAREGEPAFATQLAETLRDGAAGIGRKLAACGLATEILSGDSEPAVAAVARATGIGRHLAGLRPRDKIARMEALAAEGRKAAMVGDGINDAPALAAAHVSFAPASASDIGRKAADYVFTRDSLEAVLRARRIAVATDRIVRQNIAFAIAYNALAVPLAVAGMVTPLIAAVAMSSSSIVVIANSLRLFLLDPDAARVRPRRIGKQAAAPGLRAGPVGA